MGPRPPTFGRRHLREFRASYEGQHTVSQIAEILKGAAHHRHGHLPRYTWQSVNRGQPLRTSCVNFERQRHAIVRQVDET